MSSLYEISVLKKISPTVIDLNVRVVHPDAMYISATPGFALMLLQESADEGSPILTEIDFDSVSDESWLRKYATGFISNVETRSSKNAPPEGQLGNDHEYWKRDEWLSAVIRISVSHEDWIQHLSAPQSWESASYEPNQNYDSCEPILPSQKESESIPQADAADRTGFLPIPTFFFPELYGHLSSPVWVPKYGVSAYIADETFADEAITDDVIKSMIGKPVLFTSWGSQDIGIVASEDSVSTLAASSWGQTGISSGDGQIGIARFNTKKKRLKEPLSYAIILNRVDPLIESVKVDGTTATLTISTVDPDKDLNFESASDVLAMISKMECESFDAFENAPSRLGKFLHQEMTDKDIDFEDTAFSTYAGGLIKSFSISKTETGDPIDFDAMENDELLKTLDANPWTKWVATIEVTDPVWIEHLSAVAPFSYGFDWVEEALPWDGEPIMS